MVAIAPGSPDGTLDDVLETLELTLEVIDGLRARIDEVAVASEAAPVEPQPDERPDRLLREVGRLHRRVEEIAEASWRRADDDRLQGALDAIDRLRMRVDDADPSESVLRTLDLVSEISVRLDADDTQALTELALEAVEELGARLNADGNTGRAVLNRAVAQLEGLRLEVEGRDPAEALEMALESLDDVGQRVETSGDAILRRVDALERGVQASRAAFDQRLRAVQSSLDGLTELAGALDGAVAEIADRVTATLIGHVELAIGASTERLALAPSDSNAAVVAQAAAAMSRLDGRLDAEFGSVERSVERLDRHVLELEQLMRANAEPRRTNGDPRANGSAGINGSDNPPAAVGLLSRFRTRGRPARR